MRIKKLFIVSILFLTISAFSIYLSSCGVKNESTSSEIIEKVELTDDMVYIPESYNFDGSSLDIESSIRINYRGINFVKGTDYDLTYQYSGTKLTGTATVEMKSDNIYLYGKVTKSFILINKQSKEVHTIAELKQELINKEYKKIVLTSSDTHEFVIDKNEEITIPSTMGVDIKINAFDEFYNFGTINVEGSLGIGLKNDYFPIIYNLGTINSTGTITFGYCRVYNSGTINSEKPVNNRSYVYTNSNFNYDNGSDVFNKGTIILREKINEENLNLNIADTDYTGEEKTVTVSDGTSVTKPFVLEYENNITPGVAKVKISIPLDDQKYYMDDTVKTFNINKGTYILSSEADLETARGTNNYDKFIINTSNFTFNNDLTINEDETLTIERYKTTFSKKLENNGTIILDNNASISIDDDLINDGEIKRGTIISNSDLENNGSIDIVELRLSGSLENNGSLSASSFNIEKDNEIINTNSIELGKTGYRVDLSNSNITNSGTFTNNSELAYDNRQSTFTNTSIFNNLGTIYTFNELNNVNGTIFYRKDISSSQVDVRLEYDNIDYDETEHIPNVLIDNQTIKTSEFSKNFEYCDSTKTVFKDAGLINVTIKSNSLYSKYYGEKVISYNINKSIANIGSEYVFRNRVGNENYSGYKLTASIVLQSSNDPYTIKDSQTLDLNGYTLSLKSTSYIYNYGTIKSPIASNSSVDGGYSIFLDEYSKIDNYSIINNDGIIYLTEFGTKIIEEDTSSITGNGNIYSHNYSQLGSSTNNIYIRYSITDKLKLEYDYITYNHQENKPRIYKISDDIELTGENFIITYDESPIKAGEYSVSITPNSIFNHEFVGKTTLSYSISSNIKYIEKDSDWTSSIFNYEIYDKYQFTSNITQKDSVIELPSDVIVDFGIYRITNINNVTIKANENTEVWISLSSPTEFSKYLSNVTKITLTGNLATTNSGIRVELQESTLIENLDNKFTLDLNGYDIENYLDIHSTLSYDINIINTSTTRSKIKETSNLNYAVNITGVANIGDYIFNLTIKDNITIEGLSAKSYENRGIFNVTIENVTIDNYYKTTTQNYAVNILGINNPHDNLNDNFNILFKNSLIRGKTGVTIGSSGGNVTFDNTSIYALQEENAQYKNTSAGKAIYVDRYNSDMNKFLVLKVINSYISSIYGYGIVFDVSQSYARNTKNYSLNTSNTQFNTKKDSVTSTYY